MAGEFPVFHPNRLQAAKAALLVVDLQTAFAPVISDFSRIVERATVMVEGAKILGLPVILSEQVPAKLGRTAQLLKNATGEIQPLEKTAFSACRASGFSQHLTGRTQVLLCGIETHICVNQTAHDLLALGYQVHLLTDAIGSRAPRDHKTGLVKMFHAGVTACTVEMALFELMGDSQHPSFRAIQKLVNATALIASKRMNHRGTETRRST